MLRNIQVALLCIALMIVAIVGYQYSGDFFDEMFSSSRSVIHIEDVTLSVEVANTDELRKKGLGGRKSLPMRQGMLFPFETTDYHGIWMHDMLMNIDIIWVSEGMRVVGIESDVSPQTYPKVFRPSVPVRYVIEVSAGDADMFGVNVGDVVTLPW